MKAIIKRRPSDDKQTLGTFILLNKNSKEEYEEIFLCHTLELAWKDNKVKESCIPLGTYKVIPRQSAKYGKHFHVLDVEGRSYILFHSGNYHTQIEGCILVGLALADINGDGYLDVTNSKKAMNKLLDLAPEGFELTIKNE